MCFVGIHIYLILTGSIPQRSLSAVPQPTALRREIGAYGMSGMYRGQQKNGRL